jgi:hypothetical protein
MPYEVLVDDNFHYMDPEARYKYGVYETADEARAVCKEIADHALQELYEPGMSADRLY